MRAYRLLQVALQAETLRWKSMATRIVMRVAFACVALLFLVGVLTFVHLAAWVGLRTGLEYGDYASAGILGGVDLLIAIIFLFLATRSAPSRTEVEALEVRRRAVQSIGSALSLMGLIMPVMRMISDRRRRSRR
jgi:hypothetical protein